MYSISIQGFSSETPTKAIEAAICRTAVLLERGAVIELFSPHIERTEGGRWCAELQAGVSMPDKGNTDRAHEALELKKLLTEDEFIRVNDRDDGTRRKAIRAHLSHLQELGYGGLSMSTWMSFDNEQAQHLQDHIQRDFTEAGNYMVIPNSPVPHRVWPALTDG